MRGRFDFKNSWLPALCTAIAIFCGAAYGEDDKPARIVSINLCTDQMLLELARPEQILSVSFLAADPISSTVADKAATIPTNRGGAEEILALDPDLVLAGSFTTRQTVRLLRNLGIPVAEFAPAQSIAAVKENYKEIGDLIGAAGKAEAFNKRIDDAVAHVASTTTENDPKLVFADYGVNGFTSGKGSLIAELATLAGFTPLADALALKGARRLSIEQLLHHRPDLLDLGAASYAAPALSTDALRHPALAYLTDVTPTVSIPSRLTSCGGLSVLPVLELLVEKRGEILAQ
ncbi:MAG: ABC transporter substrate-binding protein [Pseudomonadota bacterium]